eukprot:670483-Amphidinium_carterae.1
MDCNPQTRPLPQRQQTVLFAVIAVNLEFQALFYSVFSGFVSFGALNRELKKHTTMIHACIRKLDIDSMRKSAATRPKPWNYKTLE